MPAEFMAALKRKAGLPADFWAAGGAAVALPRAQLQRARPRTRRSARADDDTHDDLSALDTAAPARWWHALPDGRIQCDLCPRDCKLHEGQRGLCFVRQRVGDAMVLATYGRSSGFCIDPIEKKPLNHFLPGSSVFSFGTAGCNLACKFCQNWDISKSREMDTADGCRVAAAHCRGGAGQRRSQRGLHLQRPGDLCRVRDGHRRRLPCAGHQDGGGDGGLHPRRAAARVLRQDGRGQRRPEGLHRRVLSEADRLTPRAGARHAAAHPPRHALLAGDHHAADPGPERQHARAGGDDALDRRAPRARRAAALHGLPPRLQDG